MLVAVTPDGRPWDLDKLRGVVDDTIRLADGHLVAADDPTYVSTGSLATGSEHQGRIV